MNIAKVGGWILLAAIAVSATVQAQVTTVSGKVVVREKSSRKAKSGLSDVVIWLVPVGETAANKTPAPKPVTAKLVQKDKAFHPELLVLPAGSSVEFPNRDPFFHNVFSLFNGKRFDLGLYESGDSRAVRFDRVGVSYIFCNIHPEMNAVIITLDTPFYAIADSTGNVSIKDVPSGEYEMHVFAEGLSADAQRSLVRKINISVDQASIGTIEIPALALPQAHKNKYGRDYESAPANPYEH